MLADLSFAWRQLRKSPGFALTAVLTLAFGIGATTAIFTLVHAVLLKSLPVTKPGELYRLGDKVHCCVLGGYTQWEDYSIFSYELYKHFQAHTPAFADLAAFQAGSAGLGVRRAGSHQPAEARNGEFVSGNYFRTFGISAWTGRVLNESDDREGASPVAVMSYHTWQEKYGSDVSVVGSTFLLNSKPFVVVGIAPPGFLGASLRDWGTPDFWMPLADEPILVGGSSLLKKPNSNWLDIIGRVRPGTDSQALETQLKLELRQWQMSHLSEMDSAKKDLITRQEFHLTAGGTGVNQMRQMYSGELRLLFIAAGCVLLIACVNLANLLLARGVAGRQQISVRMALGASRIRMIRKALIESVLISVLGGSVGVLVAYAGTGMILHLMFTDPRLYVPIQATPSWPVLLFALVVSLLTGAFFGVAPAWVASHAQPIEAVRGVTRSTTGKISLPQKALVVTQAALSLVLLCAAVMLSQSLRNLQHRDLGFDSKDRYLVWADPLLAGYRVERLESLYEQIQERLQRIPGVQSVSVAQYAPMSGDNWSGDVQIEGKPEPRENEDNGATFVRVMPGFFNTVGNKMLVGRPITQQDTATSRNVAVINQAFADRFFKGENPIGKHFGDGGGKHAGDYEIVGVAANMIYNPYNIMNSDAVRPMYFMAEAQSLKQEKPNLMVDEVRSHYLHNIVLWAPGNHANMENQVRRALAEIDPNLPVEAMDSYEGILRSDFSLQSTTARLTALFGVVALLLAAVGLYGVTAYSVEQRTNEIGIRMALGAGRSSVLKMVLRGAFLQVGLGLAIGIPAAILAGKGIANQLYAVTPWNPVVLLSAVSLLSLAATIAAILPSHRAASIEPMEVLRNE